MDMPIRKLAADILAYFHDPSLPFATKTDPKDWSKTLAALDKLKTLGRTPASTRYSRAAAVASNLENHLHADRCRLHAETRTAPLRGGLAPVGDGRGRGHFGRFLRLEFRAARRAASAA